MDDSTTTTASALAAIEPRLRQLLPADLYAAAWLDPTSGTLLKVFEHLRTLQWALYSYVPRHVAEVVPQPGELRFQWQRGTLMFADLVGFTPLMEANAKLGPAGATSLLSVLNRCFSSMIETITRSGGNLLEFTGDALLVEFVPDHREIDTLQAVRAGLRMQRAMAAFADVDSELGSLSLGLRVGIHPGRYLRADIGTPWRMDHVLLGRDLQVTKRAEDSARRGRVNLTAAAFGRVEPTFRAEPGEPAHHLVIDDLSSIELGEYGLGPVRRLAGAVLLERSVAALIQEIEEVLRVVEPLSAYVPASILALLVNNSASREIEPAFRHATVVFVNVLGLAEAVDAIDSDDPTDPTDPADAVGRIVGEFSRAFTLINAEVEQRGGVLQTVTNHISGSNILIYFGVSQRHIDDAARAVDAALAIRDIVEGGPTMRAGGTDHRLRSSIGVASGSVFAAEFGEPRGRREFNILGDAVNTAARLMGRAERGEILVTDAVRTELSGRFEVSALGAVALKGKRARHDLYRVIRRVR
jgi:class 3 adenylate cyclase